MKLLKASPVLVLLLSFGLMFGCADRDADDTIDLTPDTATAPEPETDPGMPQSETPDVGAPDESPVASEEPSTEFPPEQSAAQETPESESAVGESAEVQESETDSSVAAGEQDPEQIAELPATASHWLGFVLAGAAIIGLAAALRFGW